ncbi:MAG TPA: tetratricopeptide repeat protein [Desulfobulbaceae bacterium]|nr:tetratricopeptide repeat protein [Desulfobulbaceae bacterium]
MSDKEEQVDLKTVIADLEKICAEKPENVIAHHQLGLVYRQVGLIDKAIAALERALELDDHSVESMINLGAILFDQGDIDQHVFLGHLAAV